MKSSGNFENAIGLLVDYVRTRPGATCLMTSYEPTNCPEEPGPEKFYEKLGFVETGTVVDGENEMRLVL